MTNSHLIEYYSYPFTNHAIDNNSIHYDSFNNSIASVSLYLQNFANNSVQYQNTYPLYIDNIDNLGHAVYNHPFSIAISRTANQTIPSIGTINATLLKSINLHLEARANHYSEYRATLSWRAPINDFVVNPPVSTYYGYFSTQVAFTQSNMDFNLFDCFKNAVENTDLDLIDNWFEPLAVGTYSSNNFTLNIQHLRNVSDALDAQYQVASGRVLANGIDLYSKTFESFGSFLSTEIMPNMTIGGLLSIPLTLVVVIAIVKLIRG